MSGDTTLLVGLGVAALFAVWLVYSLVKKLLGLALLAALAVAVVWNNPGLQAQVIGLVTQFAR